MCLLFSWWFLFFTHWSRLTHIRANKLGHHLFKQWLITCSTPSHYRNQCWFTLNWTLGNKFQWNLNQNTTVFTEENQFENVVCTMTAILSLPQCVHWFPGVITLHIFHISVHKTLHKNAICCYGRNFLSKCLLWLTHWGRVAHICVSNLTIIGSDNGLWPGRRQAIIWTSDGIL